MPKLPLLRVCAGALVVVGCGSADTRPSPDDAVERAAPSIAVPPLPMPVSNNAVAGVETARGTVLFSFLGIDSTRAWSGLTDAAFRWDEGEPSWRAIEPVPGPPRLAAGRSPTGSEASGPGGR